MLPGGVQGDNEHRRACVPHVEEEAVVDALDYLRAVRRAVKHFKGCEAEAARGGRVSILAGLDVRSV